MLPDTATAPAAGSVGSDVFAGRCRMKGVRLLLAALPVMGLTAFSAGADAVQPVLPGAEKVVERRAVPASYSVATGPWQAGSVPTVTAEGEVVRQVWQVPLRGRTTLALVEPLRRQLREDGFEIVFECAAAACGGFDFRYALDLVPAPAMHVDLGDYRFISARRVDTDGTTGFVTLLVSRAGARGFIHEVQAGPAQEPPPRLTLATKSVTGASQSTDTGPETSGSLGARLASSGRAVLEGVTFAPGDTSLGRDDVPALAELAGFLKARPELRVVLVGHTDATGSEAANVAISRARAQSVKRRLVADHGLPPERINAEGVGYLAPLAPNDSEEGRRRNRRVEAVVIPASAS